MSNTKNLASLAAVLDDGSSGQVLQSTGSGGVQFADSSGSGVTVHANQAAMLTDAASSDEGTLHYETGTNKLYVKQTSGFYLLASITNASPTIDSFSENTGGAGANNLTAGGTFTLTSGSNTVITINATEPDLETISYSATVTSGTATDVFSSPSFPVTNQSSNVFTLTPVTSGTGGTVTIRFDASDGTNVANVSHSFEIAFVIADSHYTTLLMATDGSAGNNQDDITDAAGNHTSNITVSGDAYAGTFSPYRHGGYSAFFDGSSDYLSGPTSLLNFTIADKSTEAATIEAWVYHKGRSSSANMWHNQAILGKGEVYFNMGINGSGNLTFYHHDGTGRSLTSTGTVPLNEWTHVAATISGGTVTLYINGSADATTGTWYGISAAGQNQSTTIGKASTSASSYNFNGYISDLRVIEGTATAPSSGGPTERLAKITNTELLACHLPYFADGSDNGHTITVNGNTSTEPIGPYDYDEYSESTNGGSVYFDGNSDYLDVSGSTSLDLDGTDWTIEGWVYRTGTGSIQTLVNTAPPHTTLIISLNRSGTGNTQVYTGNGSSWVGSPAIDSGSNYPLLANQWSHVAVVKSGTTLYLYHNGKQAGSTTTLPTGFTGNFRIGAYESNGAQGEYLNGYVSDFRVAKEAVYTGAFTPPSGPLTTTGGTYPSTTNVDTSITAELLLSGTDAHVLDKSQGNNLKLIGTTAAVTSSSSPTPPNNTTISSQNSIFFDGNSDYITLADNELYGWGTGSWTFEVWLYITKTGGFNAIFDTRVPGTQTGSFGLGVHTTGKVQMYASPSAFYYPQGSGDVLSFNTWQHLAIVKDASTSTTTMYFNGTAASTTYSDTRNYGASQPVQIGKDDTTSNYFGGYMQDMRITKGLARTISVPSAPLKG